MVGISVMVEIASLLSKLTWEAQVLGITKTVVLVCALFSVSFHPKACRGKETGSTIFWLAAEGGTLQNLWDYSQCHFHNQIRHSQCCSLGRRAGESDGSGGRDSLAMEA